MEGSFRLNCEGLFGFTLTTNQPIFYHHLQLENVAWELHANVVTGRIRFDLFPPPPFSPDPFQVEFGKGSPGAIAQDDNGNKLKLTVARPDGTILEMILSMSHTDYHSLAIKLDGFGTKGLIQFSNGQWVDGTLEAEEAGDEMPVPLSAPISVNHVAPSGLGYSEDDEQHASSSDN